MIFYSISEMSFLLILGSLEIHKGSFLVRIFMFYFLRLFIFSVKGSGFPSILRVEKDQTYEYLQIFRFFGTLNFQNCVRDIDINESEILPRIHSGFLEYIESRAFGFGLELPSFLRVPNDSS